MQTLLNVFANLKPSKRHSITYFSAGPLGEQWRWLSEDIALRESVFTSWEITLVSSSMSYALTFPLTSKNRSSTSFKMGLAWDSLEDGVRRSFIERHKKEV